MKWFAAILIVVTVLLQYRLWLSGDGIREVARLKAEVQTRQAANQEFAQRNRQLAAEVADLKTGMTALEERARSELGMIARNESFFQVVPHAVIGPAATPPRTRTAAAAPR
ncbi:MAG: cell division protein FtsB [Steroidobacteraceae bacterium]|nr:cell division protein FtsB [Nevskiaceae bacterium]MCP5339687.1 cell division protein FtsB [Nevskiaceae bacterium]MCP5360636.1 cell division protein FtsB [Nevskiaceae bacterium]